MLVSEFWIPKDHLAHDSLDLIVPHYCTDSWKVPSTRRGRYQTLSCEKKSKLVHFVVRQKNSAINEYEQATPWWV